MKKVLILLTGFIFFDCSQTQTIQVPKEIEEFYSSYNKAWGNADFNWGNYQSKNDMVIIEQNFTRFLKDSSVMKPRERTASYILRKQDNKFKIVALIPHSPVGSK